MPDTLPDLFRRVRQRSEPMGSVRPDLVEVRVLARRIRTRRRVWAAAVTSLAVVTVTVPTLYLGRTGSEGTPATTPDGFLSPADLLRRDEPDPPSQWQVMTPAGSDAGSVATFALPTCGRQETEIRVPSGRAAHRRWQAARADGSTGEVTETVVRLDAPTAGQADRLLRDAAECRLGSMRDEGVLAGNEAILVTGSMSLRMRPSGPVTVGGPVTMGTGYGRARQTLVIVTARSSNQNLNAGLPGQTPWLIDLTARAVERATGQDVEPPSPNSAALQAAELAARTSAPPGMLTPADLGTRGHWQVSTQAGDTTMDEPIRVRLPGCGTEPFRMITTAGSSETYRGSTTDDTVSGTSQWTVEEARVTVPERDLAVVRSTLTSLTACRSKVDGWGQVAMSSASPLRIVVANPPLKGEQPPTNGEPPSVEGWTLTGRTLIYLSSIADSTNGSSPPAGHATWLFDLLLTATTRAGG